MDAIPFIAIDLGVTLTASWYAQKRVQCNAFRALFVLIIVCCASVCQLVVCEVMDAGPVALRAELWQLSTNLLLVLLGFVVPLVQTYRLTGRFAYWRVRLLLTVLGYIAYLAVFLFCSAHLPVERYEPTSWDPSMDSRWYSIRQDMLACISVAGIAIMALLCGISSVSAPYTAFFYSPPIITETDIAQIQCAIQSTEELMAIKEREITRLQLDMRARGAPGFTNMVSKVLKALRPDEVTNNLRASASEYNGLETLRSELISDREAAEQRIREQTFARSFFGRVWAIVYVFFSLYCVYRIIMGYVRICWYFYVPDKYEKGTSGPRDAVVLRIAEAFNAYWPSLTVNGWMRVIGSLMSAVVFITAFSGAMRMLSNISRRFRRESRYSPSSYQSSVLPSNIKSTLSADPIIVAHLAGVYVLSVATVLRFNVPAEVVAPIASALASPLTFSSIQLWNDLVLCGSSTLMTTLLLLSYCISSAPVNDDETLLKYD